MPLYILIVIIFWLPEANQDGPALQDIFFLQQSFLYLLSLEGDWEVKKEERCVTLLAFVFHVLLGGGWPTPPPSPRKRSAPEWDLFKKFVYQGWGPLLLLSVSPLSASYSFRCLSIPTYSCWVNRFNFAVCLIEINIYKVMRRNVMP